MNPQAVNEPGFDVLNVNKRSVLYMTHPSGRPVAFVAIGAMLVGSIVWTGGAQKGTTVKRGQELGYFAYGGSTVVVLFPQGMMEYAYSQFMCLAHVLIDFVRPGSTQICLRIQRSRLKR